MLFILLKKLILNGFRRYYDNPFSLIRSSKEDPAGAADSLQKEQLAEMTHVRVVVGRNIKSVVEDK